MRMEPFEQRVAAFNQAVIALQKQYGVVLYAANVVLKNGEVAPMIRLSDNIEKATVAPVKEKAYDDQPKTGTGSNKKAPANRS